MPGVLRDPVLPDGHPHPCALPSTGASCPVCSLSASFFSFLFAEGRNQSVDGRETGRADRRSGLPDRGCRRAQTRSEAASVSIRRIRGRSAGARPTLYRSPRGPFPHPQRPLESAVVRFQRQPLHAFFLFRIRFLLSFTPAAPAM